MSNTVAAAHEYAPRAPATVRLAERPHTPGRRRAGYRQGRQRLLPVFTQNRVFVPNGERTSAPNQEIGDRFLIAMKLLNHSESDVRRLLAQDVDHGEPPLGLTYTYFLFLGTERWRLPDSQIDSMLAEYRGAGLASRAASPPNRLCIWSRRGTAAAVPGLGSSRRTPTTTVRCGAEPSRLENRDCRARSLGRLRPGARARSTQPGCAVAHELPSAHRDAVRCAKTTGASFWPHGVLSRAAGRLGSANHRARMEPVLHSLFGRWAAATLRARSL